MIILSKKKIIYAILSTFLIILVVAFTIGVNSNKQNYISTVSLSVSGKVVVIDAGHGKPDVGVSLLHKVKN